MIARRIRKAVRKVIRKKIGPLPKEGQAPESKSRKILRKIFRPRVKGLETGFHDGFLLHQQVRIGRRGKKTNTFRKGKPTAIIVSKFRTMKKGAHLDYGKDGREIESHYTFFGRIIRKSHADELLQLWKIVTGEMKPVGLRPPFASFYAKLPKELKEIYDEMGPGLLALPYACKSKKPSKEEIIAVSKEFFELWKKSPKRAYWEFSKRILKGSHGKEIVMEEIFK